MTSKQFYIILLIFTISLKVQKLPCIIYGEAKKDGWLIILAYMLVNIIGILLAFYILKKTKNISLEQRCKTAFAEVVKRILLLLTTFYFLMQALLMFESMQNLFEHTLFENLSWRLFSLLLLLCVIYLSTTGLKNIALNFELYFVVIIFSYVVLSIMGATTSEFSEVLPLETIDFRSLANSFAKFNLWFGDFFLVLMIGKGSKDIKLGYTLLTYVSAMVFVLFIDIVFMGIYLEYCPVQSSLISMIAEQSMLGLNIGRVDWFLILLAEMGTILSCAVCFFLAGKSLHCVLPKIKFGYICGFLGLALYLLDVVYLVDTHTRQLEILNTLSIVSLSIKMAVFVIILIYSLFLSSKSDTGKAESANQTKDIQGNGNPQNSPSAPLVQKGLRRKRYEKN